MLTSTVTLVSTGKLDVITSFAAPLIVLYKGFRWWHGRPAELSHRAATWCVIAYLAFFPVDALFLSRFFGWKFVQPAAVRRASGSGGIFLIFVSIVRLYSAGHRPGCAVSLDALLFRYSRRGRSHRGYHLLILFFISSCSVFPLSLEWNCAAEPSAPFRLSFICTRSAIED